MKETLLLLLKEADGFLSGEDIGRKLGISRTAVWKYIRALRQDGYQVEAVTNKGYHLVQGQDILTAESVQAYRKTDRMGKRLLVLDTVDSTNNVLRQLAEEGAEEGTTVIALKQEAGRGRRGKTWVSQRGDGLFLSVLFRPSILPMETSALTLMCGLSVAKMLRELGFDAWIKWPNDVKINDKKVCGILTEMSAEMERVHYVIAGIGINVNHRQFPEELKDIATSLYLETGQTWEKAALAGRLLQWIETYYQAYLSGGFAAIQGEYSALCETIGQEVMVLGKTPFSARGLQVCADGALLVEKEDGTKETVVSGEVSIRRKILGADNNENRAGGGQF